MTKPLPESVKLAAVIISVVVMPMPPALVNKPEVSVFQKLSVTVPPEASPNKPPTSAVTPVAMPML